MPYGLYISAEGAQAQSQRLDVIAHNLANTDTVGFKRELALFQARYAEAIEQGLQTPDSGALEDIGGGIHLRETKTDFGAGPLRRTGNPSDVAVEGEGFFMVQKGDTAYLTRAGNFAISADGRLTTQQGYAVLDENGSPVTIDPRDSTWEISDSGEVRQKAGALNLALVRPQSLGDLVRVGENLFKPLSEPVPIPPAERRVAPKFIEGSAVKPTSEMTEMIQAARAMEANVNMLKTQDQMLGELVNRVLKP